MRSLINVLMQLASVLWWCIPHFTEVVYKYTPPTRFERDKFQHIPPGTAVVLTRREYLIVYEVLHVFGVHCFAKPLRTFRI